MSHPINVFSEIGPLKTVLLHRPGKELENLMPDYLEALLFDDIPFLSQAQKEHDYFAEVLRSKGIEVVYLEELAAESLTSNQIREAFIHDYLNESNIKGTETRNLVYNMLVSSDNNLELINKTMAGIQKLIYLKGIRQA